MGVGIGSTVVPQVLISPVGGGKVSRDFLHFALCGSLSPLSIDSHIKKRCEYTPHIFPYNSLSLSLLLSFSLFSVALLWLVCSLYFAFSSKVRDVLLHKRRQSGEQSTHSHDTPLVTQHENFPSLQYIGMHAYIYFLHTFMYLHYFVLPPSLHPSTPPPPPYHDKIK